MVLLQGVTSCESNTYLIAELNCILGEWRAKLLPDVGQKYSSYFDAI